MGHIGISEIQKKIIYNTRSGWIIGDEFKRIIKISVKFQIQSLEKGNVKINTPELVMKQLIMSETSKRFFTFNTIY